MKIVKTVLLPLFLAVCLPASANPAPVSSTIRPLQAEAKQPHTPKPGSPERKAILNALRAEVAAEQKREEPGVTFRPAVFTPSHFRVLGDWCFIDTAMDPAYGESGRVIAALQRTTGSWRVKFTSYADDVTNYDTLAKKLGAPRSLFPKQGKLED